MREFFRSWQRKTGVLTLMMAIVLTVIWIRSIKVDGAFRFTLAGYTNLIRFSEGGVHWYRWDQKWTVKSPVWTSNAFAEMKSDLDLGQQQREFAIYGNHPDLFAIHLVDAPYSEWFVRHSWLAPPTILLAASLLCWPPRMRVLDSHPATRDGNF